MRIVISVLMVASVGCTADPVETVGGAGATWDGQTLTVTASYQQNQNDVYREYLPETVTATLRGDVRVLELKTNADPAVLFPKHYYELVVPLAEPPDGEEMVVETGAADSRSAFTFPPGFAIGPVPSEPVTFPVTIPWTPPATDKMKWWLTGCIDTSASPHEVVRGNDVTLVDEGGLTIEAPILSPMMCDVTVVVERYRYTDAADTDLTGYAIQRRTVTFLAKID